MSKMLSGVALPASNETDSMPMLYHIWSREALHKEAALAFKRPGMSINLYGLGDHGVSKEAAGLVEGYCRWFPEHAG